MPEEHIQLVSNDSIATGTRQSGGGNDPPDPREQHAEDFEQTIFITANTLDYFATYGLETEFDVSDSILLNFSKALYGGTVFDFIWNDDGSKAYFLDPVTDDVYEYAANVPYNIASLSQTNVTDISANHDLPSGMTWNSNGTKFYICDEDNNEVVEYTVGSQFSVGSLTLNNVFDTSGEVFANGMAWDDSGSRMYVIGQDTGGPGRYIADG